VQFCFQRFISNDDRGWLTITFFRKHWSMIVRTSGLRLSLVCKTRKKDLLICLSYEAVLIPTVPSPNYWHERLSGSTPVVSVNEIPKFFSSVLLYPTSTSLMSLSVIQLQTTDYEDEWPSSKKHNDMRTIRNWTFASSMHTFTSWAAWKLIARRRLIEKSGENFQDARRSPASFTAVNKCR
jgi:hypothetical protein